MDTKLRNSRKIKITLGVLIIILATVGNFFFFPLISAKGEQEYEATKYDQGTMKSLFVEMLLGSYVLYYENSGEDFPEYVDDMMLNWTSNFTQYRNYVDYLLLLDGAYYGNTTKDLSVLLQENQTGDESLQAEYQMYFVLNYDENGNLSVGNIWDSTGQEEKLMKNILECNRQINFEGELQSYINDYIHELANESVQWDLEEEREEEYSDGENNVKIEDTSFLKNCQIVFGISNENYQDAVTPWIETYWDRVYIYKNSGGAFVYAGTLVLLVLVAILLNSKKAGRNGQHLIEKSLTDQTMPVSTLAPKGFLRLAEAAVIGVICGLAFLEPFVEVIYSYDAIFGWCGPLDIVLSGNLKFYMDLLEMFAMVGFGYTLWYVSVSILCPVFSMGIREYVRQYSLIYWICSKGFAFCKKFLKKTREEIHNLDFSDHTIKTIRKIVILNFIVLAVISCFWFFGIILLLIYSVVVFFLLKKQYYKVRQDYQSLQQATSKMAAGDLEYEDVLSWGIFEPLKKELHQIRNGFSKAVEEEVKSQRMKTELITNVSHDLKTPLTAITTYVELLKNSQITEEERQSYVEILERKSLRLKVLVEDLFEVSKANSNTISLEFMEVDVVNLLKQVCVEHQEHFEKKGLSVKWKLPEEKTLLMLDNQKTYRIFENLFVNIEKYAMEGSRVFIEVNTENGVEIVIKNMSAQELSVTGEEITQRFVRGEESRTTEGSGLGLAIAKSFTEAQKGSFQVKIDGDLFKVTIRW